MVEDKHAVLQHGHGGLARKLAGGVEPRPVPDDVVGLPLARLAADVDQRRESPCRARRIGRSDRSGCRRNPGPATRRDPSGTTPLLPRPCRAADEGGRGKEKKSRAETQRRRGEQSRRDGLLSFRVALLNDGITQRPVVSKGLPPHYLYLSPALCVSARDFCAA